MIHGWGAVGRDAQFVILLDVEQSVEELALEDADDPVQAAVELPVLLSRSLGLLPLLQPEPVLLQELQGPPSIFLSYGHDDSRTRLCFTFLLLLQMCASVPSQAAKWINVCLLL